jgi:hypothetical protein
MASYLFKIACMLILTCSLKDNSNVIADDLFPQIMSDWVWLMYKPFQQFEVFKALLFVEHLHQIFQFINLNFVALIKSQWLSFNLSLFY